MPTKLIRCPAGSFPDPDDATGQRCIAFKELMGKSITIFQGPDCWPKAFTMNPRSDPAIMRIILAAIEREVKRVPRSELSRMFKAEPAVAKRVRAARSVRKPG